MTQPVRAFHSQGTSLPPIPEEELPDRIQKAADSVLKRPAAPAAPDDLAPSVFKRGKPSDPELFPFPNFFNPEAPCWKELQGHFKQMFLKHQYRILEASNARINEDGHLVLLKEPTAEELEDADPEVLILTSLKKQIESFVKIAAKDYVNAFAIRYFLAPHPNLY